MDVRAVLFDLDGTLVDSLEDIGSSVNVVLKEHGFSVHSLERYRSLVGDGISALVEKAVPPGEARRPENVSRLVARLREVYAARATVCTRPYEGVAELLDALGARGLAVGVLSNKPHDLTVQLVRSLLSMWPFAPVLGDCAARGRKPDPAGALEAAAAFGLAPQQVLYVGDTPTDIRTARAAGMPFVAAAWGFRDAEELAREGATRIAATPLDILGHLGAGTEPAASSRWKLRPRPL